jgi:RNA polymerase sigma-70 factor (ECF subfamily)
LAYAWTDYTHRRFRLLRSEAFLIDIDQDLLDLDDDVLAKQVPDEFAAFGELYRRYLCPVYRYIRAQTPSEAVAEDLTAQVFFKALTAARSFRGDGGYAPWIFRIAHNTVCSWRQRKERSAVLMEEVPDLVDSALCPASQVVVGEARSLVWDTVASLPPAQNEVVALRYIQDFSIEEISSITGRTRGAVRILLHRARQKLRNALEELDVR